MRKIFGPGAVMDAFPYYCIILMAYIWHRLGAPSWIFPIVTACMACTFLSRENGYYWSQAKRRDRLAIIQSLATHLATEPQPEPIIARLRELTDEVDLNGCDKHPLFLSGPLAEIYAGIRHKRSISNTCSDVNQLEKGLFEACHSLGIAADVPYVEMPYEETVRRNLEGRLPNLPNEFRNTIHRIIEAAIQTHFIGLKRKQVTRWPDIHFQEHWDLKNDCWLPLEQRPLIAYLRTPPPIQL